jgi:CheY-like chemotaxis protein
LTQERSSLSRDTDIPPSVLIVEDHPDNREMLEEYLTSVGFAVATAMTGVEAMAVASAIRPHVVLMDLGLPGTMDGWETTRQFKSHPVLRHSVVVAVTAHGFPAAIEKAMRAGCDAVIVKPYNIVALGEEVHRLVAHVRMRSRNANGFSEGPVQFPQATADNLR